MRLTYVGLKYVDGKMTDQMAIRAYVDKKADVPPQDVIPSTVEGIPTDVIEKREKFVLQLLEATAEEGVGNGGSRANSKPLVRRDGDRPVQKHS